MEGEEKNVEMYEVRCNDRKPCIFLPCMRCETKYAQSSTSLCRSAEQNENREKDETGRIQRVLYENKAVQATILSQKTKKRRAAIIVGALCCVALVVTLKLLMLDGTKTPIQAQTENEGMHQSALVAEIVEVDEPEAKSPEMQKSEKVSKASEVQSEILDAETIEPSHMMLQGPVKVAADNRLFLDWQGNPNIRMRLDHGEWAEVHDVSTIYLSNAGVESNVWNALPVDDIVRIKGDLKLENGELVIYATDITTTDGMPLSMVRQDTKD